VCVRAVGLPSTSDVAYRSRQPGNGVLTVPKHWLSSQWQARPCAQLTTTHAPSIHVEVAAAVGLLLPSTRRYLGSKYVFRNAHDRFSAFTTRIRALFGHGIADADAHERRPRQCQGGGAMQSIRKERWDENTQLACLFTNT
jgi:hypothetical protein